MDTTMRPEIALTLGSGTNFTLIEDLDQGSSSMEGFEEYNCSIIANDTFMMNMTNCSGGGLFKGKQNSVNLIVSIISQLFMFIVFSVGLCGNTLVIYVVTRFSKMQTVTNLYILNLAIADELFVIGIPFLIVTAHLEYWTFGSFMCKLYLIVTSLNQFTSSMFLAVLSADRYIAVCHPISSAKLRTPVISRLVAVTAWMVSALMIVPVFMYANILEVHGIKNCNMFWPENMEQLFMVYSFFMAFAIPVVLFVVFYTLVLHKLKTVGPHKKTKEKKKSHKKVTKMILTVITVYVFCYLPYWVLQLSLIFSNPRENQTQFKIVCFLIASVLTYINSAINPILYAFLSDNFKKSFMKACTCVNRQDINNALYNETSVFPRRTRGGSSRPSRSCRDRESSVTAAILTREMSTAMTPLTRSQVSGAQQSEDHSYLNGKQPSPPTSQL